MATVSTLSVPLNAVHTLRTAELELFGKALELDIRPLHVAIQRCPEIGEIRLAGQRRSMPAQLTLASKRMRRSFRFRSRPAMRTRR